MTRIPQALAEFLDGGLSILVGRADERARPDCTRGAGVRIDAAAGRMTIYVPTVGADRTLANFSSNGRVAVTFSRPYDNRSYQLKGRVRSVAATSAEDHERQQRWLAAFVEQLAIVGVARSVPRRWRITPSVAVDIDVEELFEQTPGPGAGKRLGT